MTMVFSFMTAAVIAEVCSASPSAGSIYLWAAEAGGPRFGRLLGFVVAWWSTTAWTTFCASKRNSVALLFSFEIETGRSLSKRYSTIQVILKLLRTTCFP